MLVLEAYISTVHRSDPPISRSYIEELKKTTILSRSVYSGSLPVGKKRREATLCMSYYRRFASAFELTYYQGFPCGGKPVRDYILHQVAGHLFL